MKPVNIAELKNRLSYYLRRVQRGESILVADRGKVIARIDRVTGREAVPPGDAEWVERLIQVRLCGHSYPWMGDAALAQECNARVAAEAFQL